LIEAERWIWGIGKGATVVQICAKALLCRHGFIAIFMEDSEGDVQVEIEKAFCPPQVCVDCR
jgi:hypothetical protein